MENDSSGFEPENMRDQSVATLVHRGARVFVCARRRMRRVDLAEEIGDCEVAIGTSGTASGSTHPGGAVRPRAARRASGYFLQVGFGEFPAQMVTQDRGEITDRRQWDHDAPIEAPGPQDRRIDPVTIVRGADEEYPGARLVAIKALQEPVHHLSAVVAIVAGEIPAVAERVEFVDQSDAGGSPPRQSEELAHGLKGGSQMRLTSGLPLRERSG
ncbi:hypothetical protein AX289_32070 [Methylorubrum populi]|nr:hypothetical protein AX289_32070 [Methylorubrum populi]